MTTHTAAGGPVVAGIDGSAPSLAAGEWAAREAARRFVTLRLVHGHPQPVPPASFGYPSFPVDVETPMRQARAILARVGEDLRSDHPQVQIQTALTVGSPAGVLIDESRTASLVVVGTRGLGGFAGLVAGSVSTQVAAHAHGPVLVVRGDDPAAGPGPQSPVVVGVDGSPESTLALRFALEAAAASEASLIAIYAWQALPTGNLGPVTPWHYDPDEAEEEARRLLAEQLAGCSERYPQVTIERRTVLSFNPAETLVEASGTAGLVAVGSRGRGGFTGLVLGSTSRTLVHHAHCSIAVIHRHLADR
jgi:nucleotide-binding universal stress UspA family protein